MPILYVNPSRRRGRAKARKGGGSKGRRGRKMPSGLARYWKAKRSKARKRKPVGNKRRARAKVPRKKRSRKMAKRRKKRRAARKSPRRKKRRAARRASPKKRRRKARRTSPKKRRRGRRRKSGKRRKARRGGKRRAKRRKGRRRKARRTKRRKARRTRRSRRTRRARTTRSRTTVMMRRGPNGTVVMGNPTRRRRRRKSRRGRRRTTRGRARKRYGSRSYRRNPGNGILGFITGAIKEAAPVLLALYGARLIVRKVGPMIPGVNMLPAMIQGPALAVGALVGAHYATKKVGFLAKRRGAIMMGASLALVDAVFQAFAPASVKGMLGVGDIYDGLGDYVAVGDYLSVGGTPIDDDIAMSDYVAVGGDGVEEELGMGVEEELGIEEELGNDLLGGMSSSAMLKQVPTRGFLQPVPARSFTKQIPGVTAAYDNAGQLYQGTFRGGFLGS